MARNTKYPVLLTALIVLVALSGLGRAQQIGSPASTFHARGERAAPRAVNEKLADFVNLADYGAKCNGTDDDLPAFDAAFKSLLATPNAKGGTLWIPAGTCTVSNTVVIPGSVNVRGVNMSVSRIRALPAFPPDTAVVAIGNPTDKSNALHFSYLTDVIVEATDIPGSTGIYSNRMQEGSFIENVMVFGYQKYGIDLESFGIQNSYVRNIYSSPSQKSSTAIGIRLSHANSRMSLEKLTIYGWNGPRSPATVIHQKNPAILLDASDVAIRDLHVEGFQVGVKVDQYSFAEIDNFYGSASLPVMVWFTNKSAGGIVKHLAIYPFAESGGVNPATLVGIQDDLSGNKTGIARDQVLALYSVSKGPSGPTVLTTSSQVPSYMGQLGAGHFVGGGPVPTCAPGPAAGGGAACKVTAGHDSGLEVMLTTGASPQAKGSLFTITWGTPFGAVPFVRVNAANSDAGALSLPPFYDRGASSPKQAAIGAASALTPAKSYSFEVFAQQ